MIDIHTHILPYVDDGSSNMDTSIQLIKMEYEQGVTDIFVTPHYYPYRDYISTYQENLQIFRELVEETGNQKIPVTLHLGNEIYYDKHTIHNLSEGIISPLGQSKHVLIEFSMTSELEDIPEAINNLTAKGYVPVIAHPERYSYITDINDYRMMRHMGAKIQINSGSVTGYYGKKIKKFVWNLLKYNLVDFVASDVHDFRPGSLKEAYQEIERRISADLAVKLFRNADIFK